MEALIPISFFVCIAAVMILRPMTKKFGSLIEQVALERQARAAVNSDQTGLRQSMENLTQRLALIEERLDFTERLISVERAPMIGRQRRGVEDRAGFIG
jgi:hypothetical protein